MRSVDTSQIKVLEAIGGEKYDLLFKILIIGNSGVGKSSILTQFTSHEFNLDTKATIGVEFTTKYLQIDDKVIKAQIWDTAGQERFRAVTSSFYRSAVGALLVFDLTNENSFNQIDKWLEEIKNFSTSCFLSTGANSTILLVGNKSDLRHLRVISEERALEKIKSSGLAEFIETSAADTTNVVQLAYDGFLKRNDSTIINQQRLNLEAGKNNSNTQKGSKCCGN